MKPVIITVTGGVAHVANEAADLVAILDFDNDDTLADVSQDDVNDANKTAALARLAPAMLAALESIKGPLQEAVSEIEHEGLRGPHSDDYENYKQLQTLFARLTSACAKVGDVIAKAEALSSPTD